MSVTKSGASNAPKLKEEILKLDDIQLRIGESLQLQSNLEQSQGRYYVKLIGYNKGRSLLVSAPMVDGRVQLIRDGQTFVVRAFSGKSVYAFSASVLKSTSTPYSYLHLTYPAEVRGIVVRRGSRADVKVIAAAVRTSSGDEASIPGLITNISTNGCLFQSRTCMGQKGDAVTVKFKTVVNEVETYLVLDGVIRMVTSLQLSESSAPETQHGVEFLKFQAQDKVSLSAFVYQELLHQVAEI